MNIPDLIGGALTAIGLLVVLLLLGAVVVATFKNIPLARAEGPLGRNLRRQQRLYATYREWRKARAAKGQEILSFDQWKEANDR